MTDKRASEIFGGTFLIGLAILFLVNWWWPGIMYVIGIALIARTVAQGRSWTEERAGVVCIGIGVIFTLINVLNIFTFNWWPLLLILLGLYLLFGNRVNIGGGSSGSSHKDKNDLV
ncbi:MAG: hypothetical protein IT319_00810 [Anaerolineae bacterium]|nr:hypothetical protein [Anaerolineae bacterium]